MNIEEIYNLIAAEFESKTLGVTEQYLEIHTPVYEDEKLKIVKIDKSNPELIVAYLPVEDEYFFFAVYINSATKEVCNISTETRVIISLIAIAEDLTSQELQSLTIIPTTGSWDKNALKANKKATYSNTGIEIEHLTVFDTFENQIKDFLSTLSKDKPGIAKLNKQASTYIRVIIDFHHGNQLLGNAALDLETIQKLAELNLSIEFQIAAWGNSFK